MNMIKHYAHSSFCPFLILICSLDWRNQYMTAFKLLCYSEFLTKQIQEIIYEDDDNVLDGINQLR